MWTSNFFRYTFVTFELRQTILLNSPHLCIDFTGWKHFFNQKRKRKSISEAGIFLYGTNFLPSWDLRFRSKLSKLFRRRDFFEKKSFYIKKQLSSQQLSFVQISLFKIKLRCYKLQGFLAKCNTLSLPRPKALIK